MNRREAIAAGAVALLGGGLVAEAKTVVRIGYPNSGKTTAETAPTRDASFHARNVITGLTLFNGPREFELYRKLAREDKNPKIKAIW